MGTRKQVENDLAKILFVNEGVSQKEIAERLNLTEKTVSKWAKDGEWDKLKTSMLVTKDNQLTALYRQLENLNVEIATRPIIRDIPDKLLLPVKVKSSDGSEHLENPVYTPEDFPVKVGNFPTSKEADMISKLTTAIKRLETETNIGETVEISKQLVQFVRSIDAPFSNQLLKYCDLFIQDKMK
jgi:transcriptional regulator with XRE-family HTH domain